MDQKKPPVAKLTPDELARFNAWQKEEQVSLEASQDAMRALMFSIKTDKLRSLNESRAMWSDFKKAHPEIDLKGGCYIVDRDTGEITAHENGPMLVIGGMPDLMGGGNDTKH